MVEIITTISSVSQAEQLLDLGVNTLYIGSEEYGLRFPAVFSKDEIVHLTKSAHNKDTKVRIGVNSIMHSSDIKEVSSYLEFLSETGVDEISVGDTGVINLIEERNYHFTYIYAGETLVTSARQLNFYGKHGAVGGIIAREVPFEELKEMFPKLCIHPEILVFGASCIHHSLRPLLTNYFDFVKKNEGVDAERGWFISDPENPDSHYSIFEDRHGTHIYATNDISLMMELEELYQSGYKNWLLDGIFIEETVFLETVNFFVEAKKLILSGEWTVGTATALQNKVSAVHPLNRGLDTGFYYLSPSEIS